MNLNPRIMVAFVVGLVMVGGSYLLAERKEEAKQEADSAIVTKESVRSFIKVEDQDQDGLPDWQNDLNLHTIYLDDASEEGDMTETATLAVELASLASEPGADINNLYSNLNLSLARNAVDDQYGPDDIITSSDNTSFALRAYGNAVASIVLDNAPPAGTEDELTVLHRATTRQDASVLEGLDPTIASYEAMVNEMLATPVPSSFIREHLSLINVYQAILNDIRAFRLVFEDALPAMSRFRRYQADAEALYLAVSVLYLKLDQAGIQWTDADAVSRFIKIE